MSEDTGFQFTDDAVPRAYDEVLVRRLFEPWALLLLDVANSKPSWADAAPIIYIESPAAPLGVESAAFDCVVCQQGLQFFPDRLGALREMRRALKPGGQLAITAWAHIEDNPFYAALHAALRESVPGDLADRLLAPFGWPDAQ